MKIYKNSPSRIFRVGFDNKILIRDCGKIFLKNDEIVTFSDKNNNEYDIGKKSWGYYATPSINGRLKNNNFHSYLIKNIYEKIYLMIVHNSKQLNFNKYINDNHLKILLKLDNFLSTGKLNEELEKYIIKNRNCLNFKCKNIKKNIIQFYNYNNAPPKEPNYGIKNYKRKVKKCICCNHFFAEHKLINEKTFYKKNYATISHGKDLSKKFNQIINLGEKSDNFHRIKRFLHFFKDLKFKPVSLLDVGSGLSVFLYGLKKEVNWKLHGIEPEINFTKFGRETLKLNIINSNLNEKNFKKKFNIISLNKVVEHVKNPIKFLQLCKKKLLSNGYLYIEVPDGLTASQQRNGRTREEFMVDHFHIFSMESLKNLLNVSGFDLLEINKIIEESGKYTLYAFCKKK
jgi:2-polyprenyl-3-methyl-5-hydroxy-6-metoxy-1,4-benzoquinol methylase